MNTRVSLVLTLITFLAAPISANWERLRDRGKEDHLLSFVVGAYQVVGTQFATGKPYAGTVVMKRTGSKLIVERKI